MKKYKHFLSENFHFFCGRIFSIFELACFRNEGKNQSRVHSDSSYDSNVHVV